MSLPTNAEQELLELINRLRSNPAGEVDHLITSVNPLTGATPDITNAITFFNVDAALFRQQMQSFSAVAPLAWNTALEDAAAQHSALMIQNDSQSHQLPGEPGLGVRLQNAGYSLSTAGENIYAFAESVLHAHAGFVIDWGFGTGGMQTPPGHRQNLLSSGFTEIGIDITPENNPATQVGPLVITQDLGNRFAYTSQIVGVVFGDVNLDSFYEAGEGYGGVTVTAANGSGTFTTTTWASGGYQISAPQGIYTITFSGGALVTPKSVQTTLASVNVKVDDVVAVPACFAEGTKLDSEHEAIAVNHLRVGQQLRLASGGTAPIQWIGYRRVDCRRHPQPDKVWPVRIKAGAFGEGLPLRDLFLSPEHAVFIDGGMVPIRCLINGTTIAQIPTNEVTYYHVELAEHDVILAEGLPCESYLAVGGRAEFENGGGVQRLFLDFSTPSLDAFMLWETKACAPLVQCGPRLEAARAFINARTRAMDSPSSMKAA